MADEVSEVSRVQEPERWPCTKPAVREHDGNAGPLPEVEHCTHDECRPPGPTVLLDVPERTVDDVHRDLDQVVAKLTSKLAADPSPTKARHAHADRDIPEEMVEKVAQIAHAVFKAWETTPNRDGYVGGAILRAAHEAVAAALAGRQVVDTSIDDLDPEALNAVANAVHDHYGFVRLDVRYEAAAAAIRIVEDWRTGPVAAAGSGSGEG